MNYRHVYHAGNFADLLKHAVLTDLLYVLTRSQPPLTVIDTHAGAGRYDLEGCEARRTGEGAAGVGRLMATPDSPAIFDELKAAVARANAPGTVRYYPGSPVIIQGRLRSGDRYIGCEFRDDDYAALRSWAPRVGRVAILKADGWVIAAERAPKSPTPLLLLIDPPYERGDDAGQAIRLSLKVMRRNPQAVIAIWTPVKDLAGFDALVMAFADAVAPASIMIAEVRLRPLTDPMRMNGCAMIVANPTPGLDERSAQAAAWIAGTLGEVGGSGRVERVASSV